MTREEAINIISQMIKDEEGFLSDNTVEAHKMAIQALSQEPCDDAISREDAEQMFRNIRCRLKPQDYKSAEEFNTRDLMLLNAEQMIHALPSVTQKSETVTEFADRCRECGARYGKLLKQKMGYWIEGEIWEDTDGGWGRWQKCSVCRQSKHHKTSFCPDCGARMESEEV